MLAYQKVKKILKWSKNMMSLTMAMSGFNLFPYWNGKNSWLHHGGNDASEMLIFAVKMLMIFNHS